MRPDEDFALKSFSKLLEAVNRRTDEAMRRIAALEKLAQSQFPVQFEEAQKAVGTSFQSDPSPHRLLQGLEQALGKILK